MHCANCGTEVDEKHKYCINCGKKLPEPHKRPKKPVEAAAQPGVASASATPTKPKLDVTNIIRNKPGVFTLKENHNFQSISEELERDLKTWAFKGLFSRPPVSQIKVMEITKVYEPIHFVRGIYEGSFEVEKEFTLNLDSWTKEITLGSHTFKVEAEKDKPFNPQAPQLKITGLEKIQVKNEKGVYVDMSGKENPGLAQYLKDKELLPFDPEKVAVGKINVLKSNFDMKPFEDRVLTQDVVKRPTKYKSVAGEHITVELGTVYYPKFKVVCKNLQNNAEKVMMVSAVDGTVLPSEKF